MRMPIGEFLLTRLVQAGVTELIGVPGDFNLNLLEQVPQVPGIRFVGTTNELNAAYAADGYSRARGLSALLTTYGVGELSALNGIAGAAAEHVPVVSIAGAPPLYATEGRWELHHSMADGDFSNMLSSIGQFTAAAVRITPINAAEEIDRILHTAIREKRPVHIQVPSDISHLTIEVPDAPFDPGLPSSDPERLAAAADAVLELWARAQRPAMLIDQDADRHGFATALQALSRLTGTHYAQLGTGKGILSEHDPLFLGTYGGANSPTGVRLAIEDADFLLTTTPRFIETNSGSFTHHLPQQAIVDIGDQHVSVHGAEYVGITVSELLAVLVERLEDGSGAAAPGGSATAGDTAAGAGVASAPEAPAADVAGPDMPGPDAPLDHARLWPRMAAFVNPGDTVIAEAGTSHIGLSVQTLPEGVRYINSGIWGAIGFTLPCLFGSQLAEPERRHLLFIGDGSFQLTAQELSTILAHEQAPIIFLLNNRGYTIERWIMGMDAAYNDVADWDYAALPQVFKRDTTMRSHRVHTFGQLEEALAAAGAAQERGVGSFVELHLDAEDAPAGLKAFGPATARFDYGPRGPVNG